MRILTLCAEYAPLAKVGGLGDVTAGLSNWLVRRGHQLLVVLPYYGVMRSQGVRIEAHAAVGPLTFRAGDTQVQWSVHRMAGSAQGDPDVFLVDAPELFGDGVYASGEDEALRFMLLSQAGLALAVAAGFSPDILHCHDWHAAPAAVMLRGAYRDERVFRQTYTVLTIHNIGYQGVFSDSVLERCGHGELRPLFAADDLAVDQINFLKAGIAHADALTTVSPTHAREIQTPEYGKGLEELLRQKRHRLAGILNGVDYARWSPESDTLLPARYSARDPGGKRIVREAVLRELHLQADADVPVVGLVSRLAEQKGIDLLIAALPALLRERSFVCAFLGNGEAAYVADLKGLMRQFPGRIALAEVQDERLAHWVLSGSDIALVPSRYEPCGLTQLYAMRYGTVPVVRLTGGLADTVQHFDPATGQGTGSVFLDADAGGVGWGLRTALDWFADRAVWSQLMRNGMRQDYSWAHQGPRYEELFARLGA